MTKPEIEGQLRRAFAHVPRPPDSEICRNQSTNIEERELAHFLRPLSWEDLIHAELWGPQDIFLTPAAFRYYLPGFILNVWSSGDGSKPLSAVGIVLPYDFALDNLASLGEDEYRAVREVVICEMNTGSETAKTAWEWGWKNPKSPWHPKNQEPHLDHVK